MVSPDAVQVVAHRGASSSQAEHTLAAYETAIADGADALECDVRLTRDGVLVCVHDRRVNRTSDGRGVVSTLELAELEELDFASWKGKERRADPLLEASWDVVDLDRGGVLTLERLVQLTLDSRSRRGRPLQLYVEAKHPTRYGAQVEQRLVELLERYGLANPLSHAQSPVTVMSFAAASLRRLRSLAPAVPTVYLMHRVPVRYRDGTLPSRTAVAGPRLSVLRRHPSYVQRVHDQGHRVFTWVVDTDEDVDLALELGVDSIITDDPRRVVRRLGRR